MVVMTWSHDANMARSASVVPCIYFTMMSLGMFFLFQDPIQDYVNKHIDLILYERGISSRKNITLVGVHVRRGDKLLSYDMVTRC
jgi:hypothetical protein